MMSRQFSASASARAPGKLILSGEHAVVYGHPAIALAVDRYAESTVRSASKFSHSSNFTPPVFSPSVFFNFLNLKYAKSFTLSTLFSLKHELQNQYHAFLEGKCGIRDVLKKPFELLQFTVSNLLEKGNITPNSGIEVHTSSNIPIGYGMGSSAASVMSTLFALAKFYDLEFDPTSFLNLGKEAENLQHGRSSGLDLHLALTGGCLKFEKGKAETRPLPKFPLRIIETGKPESTTGQCVIAAALHFEKSSIGNDFADVTRALDTAARISDVKECIRSNHRLLNKIGVVPPKVQEFIHLVEKEGGAAKICGAGSIQGDAAGVLLLVTDADHEDKADNSNKTDKKDKKDKKDKDIFDEEKRVLNLVSKFGYTLQKVQGDLCGTRLVG